MHGIHEAFALGVDEHAAFAAESLGHEETRGVFLRENRRVKLDVFEVDQTCAHAVRHRHTVADAAGLVGRMLENLPEPAGGEDGFFGDHGDRLAGGGVEHVGAETRERFVFIGGGRGIVREREQVDRDPAGATGDARRGVHAVRDALEDGVACGVFGVDDAFLAVAAFARQLEFAGGGAVEIDVEFVEQELFHGGGTFVDELGHGRGIRGVVAGGLDVVRERTGGGGLGWVVDDPALRPIAVGGERFGQREQLDVITEPCGV